MHLQTKKLSILQSSCAVEHLFKTRQILNFKFTILHLFSEKSSGNIDLIFNYPRKQ